MVLTASVNTRASFPSLYGTFEQGLRELDWTEGYDLVIEWRFLEGRLESGPALSADQVLGL